MNSYGPFAPRDHTPAIADAAVGAPAGPRRARRAAAFEGGRGLLFVAPSDFWPKDDGSGKGSPGPRKSGEPARWNRAGLTTDFWNPPTSERQHGHQRILAVVVAFVLAAVLAHAGW